MKFIIGIIIGTALILGMGFNYTITNRDYYGKNETSVDVRLIEIDNHQYIIAVASNLSSRNTASTISMLHHVGCKCNHK